MKRKRFTVQPRQRSSHDADVSSALDAMSAADFRDFVREILRDLEDAPRARIEDALLRRAATGGSRWRPNPPSNDLLRDVEQFIHAARRIGQANPSEVDAYLRQGIKASLAGDYAGARAILGTVLRPIAGADIDLGQHELVDEVLTVDVQDCAARYVAAIYFTTPLVERAGAVFDAIAAVRAIAYLNEPIAAMEHVTIGALPDLDEFLPRWIARLESESRPETIGERLGDRPRPPAARGSRAKRGNRRTRASGPCLEAT